MFTKTARRLAVLAIVTGAARALDAVRDERIGTTADTPRAVFLLAFHIAREDDLDGTVDAARRLRKLHFGFLGQLTEDLTKAPAVCVVRAGRLGHLGPGAPVVGVVGVIVWYRCCHDRLPNSQCCGDREPTGCVCTRWARLYFVCPCVCCFASHSFVMRSMFACSMSRYQSVLPVRSFLCPVTCPRLI